MFNDIQKNSVLILFLTFFSTIISGDKLAKKTAGLVTLGIATTVLTVEQYSEKKIQETRNKLILVTTEDPKIKKYAENINDAANKSLIKNVFCGDYFFQNMKLIQYTNEDNKDVVQSKKNTTNFENYLYTYFKESTQPTIDYYTEKVEKVATIAGIASFFAGGYALSRFATPLSHNPRLVIPMIINRAIITGVTGEVLLSSAAYYANNNPEKIINGLAHVYGKYENIVLNDIDAYITNNCQSIRELLIDNKNNTAAYFIKQQPFKKSILIKNNKEKNKEAFITLSKKLQSPDSSFLVRNVTRFLVSENLQLNNNQQK